MTEMGRQQTYRAAAATSQLKLEEPFFYLLRQGKRNKEEGGQMLFVGVQLTPPSGILSPPPIRRTPP
jgi:hypothetical protein